jgi:hypothetical protein
MAKSKNKGFPATDEKFDIGYNQLMNHLLLPDATSSSPGTPSWQRLGLDNTNEYTPLLNMLGDSVTVNTWNYVYPLEKHRASHNGTLTAQKNSLKKNCLAIIRPLRMALKAKDKSDPGFLTEVDKQFFFIPVPNPKTASSFRTGQSLPVISLYAIKHLEHIIDVRNPDTPKSTALPDDVQFIELMCYIGTVAPTDPSQYTRIWLSGKFRNISHFTEANVKQQAWYIVRYISTIGEEGDWSAPFSTAIA